ncbi:hypothetical protein BFP97_15920 [Roseivirga sp. 4D4]|uniref:Pycsar system effector family protein n=1 Tax=Roseivirga sp. 4D4 TaxID=1889784 RepID=UPI000853423C|nr:Pycsar system effector family protein [Roseivirga sp. 4D4]OEK02920.1 hypothetical protein BFP97_15920 [Roseivirga sp. 4D4]
MKQSKHIVEQVRSFLIQLYKEREKEQTPFHSIDKTWSLMKAAEKIGSEEGLNDQQCFEVIIAAAFIHTGQWEPGETHLQKAIQDLEDFEKGLDESFDTAPIQSLMKSVEDDSDDKTLQEEVFYDAYYEYLGKKKLIRQLQFKTVEEDAEESVLNALREGYELITNHKYRTEYAIKNLAKRKAKNSQKLLARIQKEEGKEKKAKRKSRKLGRGIETMYRTVYRNHINLSSIADQKANLIIRVNTIILSIIITLGGTGYTFFEEGFFKYSRFTIPVMIFVAGSLAAVIFAILSARPKVTNKEVNKKRLLGKESSILFFGNFTALKKTDFVREMGLFRQNDDRVYDSMSVDIYFLGLVLDKKYKLVTYSYNVFMAGLTLSVLTFMTLFMFFQYS